MGHTPPAKRLLPWLRALPGLLLERASLAILQACIASARRTGDRRLAAGRGRTLWGITPILTLPLKSRCDQALGFKSETLVFTTYFISGLLLYLPCRSLNVRSQRKTGSI